MTRTSTACRYGFACFSSASTEGRIFSNDDLDALRVRMQPVRLVELRIARDAVEEERIERNIVGFAERRIDGVEVAAVFGAEIGRGAHAGEKRRQMGGSRLVENRRERRLGRLGLHAAQHVVGAEFDDQRVGVLRAPPSRSARGRRRPYRRKRRR